MAGFYSKGILISIILSIIANISLSQNYTNSLIPEVNNGIGISNIISYWIIGEDNWSKELFKTLYDQSIYITLFLLLFYIVVMLVENRKFKMVNL